MAKTPNDAMSSQIQKKRVVKELVNYKYKKALLRDPHKFQQFVWQVMSWGDMSTFAMRHRIGDKKGLQQARKKKANDTLSTQEQKCLSTSQPVIDYARVSSSTKSDKLLEDSSPCKTIAMK